MPPSKRRSHYARSVVGKLTKTNGTGQIVPPSQECNVLSGTLAGAGPVHPDEDFWDNREFLQGPSLQKFYPLMAVLS